MSNENLSRTERREARRNDQRSIVRRRQMKKTLIIFVVLAAIAGGIFWIFRSANQYVENLPGEQFTEQSPVHLDPGSKEHDPYNSNPPTSGWHWPNPHEWGIYNEELPDEQMVHNLEHGGIWISYNPDSLPVEQVENLKKIAEKSGRKIIMAPRKTNDAPIVLAAWTRLVKLQTVDEQQITNFVKSYQGKIGPEPNAP